MTTQPKLPEWAESFIKEGEQRVKTRSGGFVGLMFIEDVRTLASRLMAEVVPEGPKSETAWLVENDDEDRLRYRTMDGYEGIHWTYDANEAIRFSRRADAEMFSAGDESFVRIVEHMWCEQSVPGPAAEPKCKTCNDVGAVLGKQDGILQHWGPCPDCSAPTQSTWTKVDPPGHAQYVAGKKEEGERRSSSYKRCSMCDTDCAPDYPCMCPCHEGASHGTG